MKQHKLQTGAKIGEFTLVQRIPYIQSEAVNKRLKWRVQCVCGNRLTVPEYYMLRDHSPKRDCGCKRKTIKTHFKQEYGIWNMMHERCYNEKHVAYEYYGGRGIKICTEWHKSSPDGLGFHRFLEFVGARPSPQHTIDRVNNDIGYMPHWDGKVQVRWATPTEQRANQRPYLYKNRKRQQAVAT